MTKQETFIVTDELNNSEATVTPYASVEGYMYTKQDLVGFVNNELRKHEVINCEPVDTSRDLTVHDSTEEVISCLEELGYNAHRVPQED